MARSSEVREAAEEVGRYATDFRTLHETVGRIIVGHEEAIRDTLLCLFAGGNLLLEGVPGTGKTLLVRTLAQAMSLVFGRIQCTPDLMPGDVLGTWMVTEEEGRREFTFRPGPVFANVLLADEVNRATPKTQSALLEAMEEHQVTVGNKTFPLPDPFILLATQNPVEMEGTYPLPEAQLDRFLLKAVIQSPSVQELEAILDRTTQDTRPRISPVMDAQRVLEMRALTRQVPLGDRSRRWIAKLIHVTRPDADDAVPLARRYVRYGASARGAQALALCGKVLALADGRGAVAREDLRKVATTALRHRVILNFEGEADGIRTDDVISEALDAVSSI
jgi:MoxR-like ATPase